MDLPGAFALVRPDLAVVVAIEAIVDLPGAFALVRPDFAVVVAIEAIVDLLGAFDVAGLGDGPHGAPLVAGTALHARLLSSQLGKGQETGNGGDQDSIEHLSSRVAKWPVHRPTSRMSAAAIVTASQIATVRIRRVKSHGSEAQNRTTRSSRRAAPSEEPPERGHDGDGGQINSP